MKTIAITTTVPIEVLLAADYKVIDLNNLFVTSPDYGKYIDAAEREGFPKSSCAWIKGIYGACLENGIEEVVGVVEGDCSNTVSLINVLKLKGIKILPFSYPHTHDIKDVKSSIDSFMKAVGAEPQKVEYIRSQLSSIRNYAKTLDELTFKHGKATGFENHLYQLILSDFNSNRAECEELLKSKVEEIKQRKPSMKILRIGYIGVPPMTGDLYDYLETLDARIVYNEVQREFAFPRASDCPDIYHQYYDYTYPYDIEFRLKEIKRQIQERNLDGIIHYTQAFCYRAIDDIVIKKELDIPVLTIEGDKSIALDSRTKLRIEAFIDMMHDKKAVKI